MSLPLAPGNMHICYPAGNERGAGDVRGDVMTLSRLVWIVALPVLAGLGGCATQRDAFAPACPAAQLLPQAADITRYHTPGTGSVHDVTDLVLQGRVVNVAGKCEPGPNSHTVDATVTMTMELTRGPAGRGDQPEVSYFIAVSDGTDILDKKVLTTRIKFPPNIDRVWLVSDPVFMRLPVTPTKTSAAYTVWAGFQLSPEEMAQHAQSPAPVDLPTRTTP
ncbi:MAG: hypothetical protein ACREF3_06080 [Acetobacteraceae bacterium]